MTHAKEFLFYDVNKYQRFVSDLKTLIARFPDGEFFDNWRMDRLFLSLTVREKIIKFYTYINVIRVKNENCEFLRNLCADFSCSFVS